MVARRTPIRRCPQCGCTDAQACAGGCSWVEGSDLCSACYVVRYTDADLDQIIAENGSTWDAGMMAKAWKRERASRQIVTVLYGTSARIVSDGRSETLVRWEAIQRLASEAERA